MKKEIKRTRVSVPSGYEKYEFYHVKYDLGDCSYVEQLLMKDPSGIEPDKIAVIHSVHQNQIYSKSRHCLLFFLANRETAV